MPAEGLVLLGLVSVVGLVPAELVASLCYLISLKTPLFRQQAVSRVEKLGGMHRCNNYGVYKRVASGDIAEYISRTP